MTEDPNRTVHAQQAFEFTDVFGYKFGSLTFGETIPRKLTLMEPEMSTAGGRQARQSMVLVPEGEGRSIVCGWIDVSQKIGEVRTYSYLSSQFKARFKDIIDLKRAEYEALLEELEGFLKIQKIDYKLIDSAPAPAPTPAPVPQVVQPAEGSAGALIGMLVLGIGIGFGLGFLAFGL